MTTLVKNGTIVTASDRYDADVYIDKGIVTLIGQGLNVPADNVIDASGMLVMPGGIDVHTHLDMPFGGTTSADDFESGTIAAAHGGTTTLIDFAIQSFGEGLQDEIEPPGADGRLVGLVDDERIVKGQQLVEQEQRDEILGECDPHGRAERHRKADVVEVSARLAVARAYSRSSRSN